MEGYLERVVGEALCAELAQSLVMIYCRYLCHAEARQALRCMMADEPEVLRQFDALDELHAEYPFTPYAASTWRVDLAQLVQHNLELGSELFASQLQRLCERVPRSLADLDPPGLAG